MAFSSLADAKDFLNLQTADRTYTNLGFVCYHGTDDQNRIDICDALRSLGGINVNIERNPATGNNMVITRDPFDVTALMLNDVLAAIDAYPASQIALNAMQTPPPPIGVAHQSQQYRTHIGLLNNYVADPTDAATQKLTIRKDVGGNRLTSHNADTIIASLKALNGGMTNAKKCEKGIPVSDVWIELADSAEINQLAVMGVTPAQTVLAAMQATAVTLTKAERTALTYVGSFSNYDRQMAAKGKIVIEESSNAVRLDIQKAFRDLGASSARNENYYNGFTSGVVILEDKDQIERLSQPPFQLPAAIEAMKFYQSQAATPQSNVSFLNTFRHDDQQAQKKGEILYINSKNSGKSLSANDATRIRDALLALGANNAKVEHNVPGTNGANYIYCVSVRDALDITMLEAQGVDAAIEAMKFYQLAALRSAAIADAAAIPMAVEVARAERWLETDAPNDRLVSQNESTDKDDPGLTSLKNMLTHPDIGLRFVDIKETPSKSGKYRVVVDHKNDIAALCKMGVVKAARVQKPELPATPVPVAATTNAAASTPTQPVMASSLTHGGMARQSAAAAASTYIAQRNPDGNIADAVDDLDAQKQKYGFGWKIEATNKRIVSEWKDSAADDQGVEALHHLLAKAGAVKPTIEMIDGGFCAVIGESDIQKMADYWQTAADAQKKIDALAKAQVGMGGARSTPNARN